MGEWVLETELNVREIALKALYDIERNDTFAEAALDKALRRYKVTGPDKALLTELVYGTIKRVNTVDWAVERHASRPLSQMTPWIRNILRLGGYQLLYLDKIPPSAAVDESVKLAKKFGHSGTVKLVNAVLRALSSDQDLACQLQAVPDKLDYLALLYSHPRWLLERWIKTYGEADALKLCEINNLPAPLTIRVNEIYYTYEQVKEALTSEGVRVEPGCLVPGSMRLETPKSIAQLGAFTAGMFQVQDEASILVGMVVAPEPGEFVIDACSAPGSKTTHLAQLMGDRGVVVAVDIQENRLKLVKENCERLRIKSVRTFWMDARKLGATFRRQASKVLVDAPCSGLGVLRRNPDAKWRKASSDLERFSKLQQEILNGVAPCVAPGGTIVYSVCSLEPEETETVIGSFLAQNPEFYVEDASSPLPEALKSKLDVRDGFIRLLPHKHGVDGFFISRLRRSA